jgi:lysophospholipid acyltransferase (LPLAT)-like uncharacterized protein
MKFRNPRTIRMVSWAASKFLQGWIGTIRFHQRHLERNFDPRVRQPSKYIIAFWHENMVLPAYHFAMPEISVLISTHSDGQLIAEILQRLGFNTVRGSTTRGGMEAMRQMLRLSRESIIGISPDGPNGPRRRVQPGIVFLAAKTGLPIAPMGVAYNKLWRANSWDQFAIPKPFSKGYLVWGPAIHVPRNVTMETLEPHRLLVEQSINAACTVAENWAATGHYDPSTYVAPQTMPAAA